MKSDNENTMFPDVDEARVRLFRNRIRNLRLELPYQYRNSDDPLAGLEYAPAAVLAALCREIRRHKSPRRAFERGIQR